MKSLEKPETLRNMKNIICAFFVDHTCPPKFALTATFVADSLGSGLGGEFAWTNLGVDTGGSSLNPKMQSPNSCFCQWKENFPVSASSAKSPVNLNSLHLKSC